MAAQPRTTQEKVQGILLDNFGPKLGGNLPSLKPFIRAANRVVTRLIVRAAEEGLTIGTEDQEEVETWLAAHFYTVSDPLLTSESNLGASGSYEKRSFLDVAKMLDPTGLLGEVMAGQTATAAWLGKTPTEQVDYADRD